MIPDGPLHPTDAAVALSLGFATGALVRSAPGRWTAAVLVAFGAAAVGRHETVVLEHMIDRPRPLLVVGVVVATVGAVSLVVARRRPPVMRVVLPLLVAVAVLWARVPDTEIPLVAAATLVGALPWSPRRHRARSTGLLVVLPVLAATSGTVGRPDELWAAGVAAGAAAVVVYVAMTLISRATGRAGAPTTVTPSATSSRTTAPAPTIAS